MSNLNDRIKEAATTAKTKVEEMMETIEAVHGKQYAMGVQIVAKSINQGYISIATAKHLQQHCENFDLDEHVHMMGAITAALASDVCDALGIPQAKVDEFQRDAGRIGLESLIRVPLDQE